MSNGEIWISITTIVAVFLGPMFAVFATQYIDQRRENRYRKMEIFRTLMRTRKMPIHYDHVGALNLVEIEFSAQNKIIQAWRQYLETLAEPVPQHGDEHGITVLEKKREKLLTKLIHEIAQELNFQVEQLDIMQGNYLPKGWNDDEWSQKQVRQGLLNVLQGRRPLYVQQFVQTSSPYPPPPLNEEGLSNSVEVKAE